ncbi:MAG: phosphate ABC transporter substrate-binding protein PstS [Acidimicrobiales bacterium]
MTTEGKNALARCEVGSGMRPSWKRITAFVSILGAVVLTFAACSSNSSGSTTTTSGTTATTAATASLSSLEAKAPTTAVSLQETGSSLLYPLFNLWVTGAKTKFPNLSITTASTGSGTGVSAAATGTVQIGASDAYLAPSEVTQYPGLMNIPLAISSQFIAYNVPGVSGHLKLSGQVISAIYQGQITNWDDPKIKALNPGVSLSSLPIVTVHRSDSSGDTFLFTSFLSAADPSGWGAKYSYSTSVQFPNVPGAEGAEKNSGMLSTCQATKGCIAYIGISYLQKAISAGLGEAELENKSGNFELPTASTISAEASGYASQTPASGTISMIYGPAADGYPIVNYEYAIVLQKQSSPQDAAAVQSFLAWAMDSGGGSASTYLNQVNFVPLPSQVITISVNLLSKIS